MSYGDAARAYAAAGYAVFPCKERGKKPLTTRGFLDATCDERTILHWWVRWPSANIGVACGASGIAVVDADPKHGADPAEALPALGLDDSVLDTLILTGEAPEPSDEFPLSLSGVRGAHVWFRGDAATYDLDETGCELRARGSYVIVPPSAHPSGVPYKWHRRERLPRLHELPELPTNLRRARAAEPPPPGEPIEVRSRHNKLKALAVDLVRRGVVDPAAVRGALLEVNRVRCRPPIDDVDEVIKLAEWAVVSQIAQRERSVPETFLARRAHDRSAR